MSTRTRACRLRFESLEDRSVPSTFAAFDLDSPDRGPFPSDRFTVADASQLTNRRINLPLPDASSRPSDYADVSVINTLDGFNLQPRLSVPFSGPIDVTTVNSTNVFLVKVGDTTSPEGGDGRIVGINQTVWDVATNTLHVESDELLDQHTRYALVVTRGVKDAGGEPVEPSGAFERFRHDLNYGQTDDPALKQYRKDLLAALDAARQAGVAEADVVTASVFTTQSATAVLEKIREFVVKADLPGVNPKDVDIQVVDNVLTLRGGKEEKKEEKKKNYHRIERFTGQFYRAIGLPAGADADKVTATTSNGTITVTIPKKPEAQPKKIAVQPKA